jgi:hypothetical protein
VLACSRAPRAGVRAAKAESAQPPQATLGTHRKARRNNHQQRPLNEARRRLAHAQRRDRLATIPNHVRDMVFCSQVKQDQPVVSLGK